MSSDEQFTALGPAIVGFQTNSASIDRGADIRGRDLGIFGKGDSGPGVVGESIGSAGVNGKSTGAAGVTGTGTPGVFGHGKRNGFTGHSGVMGVAEGDEGAGVYGGHYAIPKPSPGISPPPPPPPKRPPIQDVTTWQVAGVPGAGVFGTSNVGNGVVGVSTGDPFGTSGADNFSHLGNGVVGKSTNGHGVIGSTTGARDLNSHGVLGKSEKTAGVVGISGPSPNIANTIPPAASGVYGFCAEGRGVLGSSVEGVGAMGKSVKGYGGYFQSQELAQVHLEPLDIFSVTSNGNPNGVVRGRGGDLLATVDKREQILRCSLWFCVKGDDATSPAEWRLVTS
jgi:hypothetical protein